MPQFFEFLSDINVALGVDRSVKALAASSRGKTFYVRYYNDFALITAFSNLDNNLVKAKYSQCFDKDFQLIQNWMFGKIRTYSDLARGQNCRAPATVTIYAICFGNTNWKPLNYLSVCLNGLIKSNLIYFRCSSAQQSYEEILNNQNNDQLKISRQTIDYMVKLFTNFAKYG